MTTLLLLAAVLCPGEVDVVTAPEAVIAIGSSMSGSLDQDGWGRNYGARQSCYLANRAWLANDLDTRAAR